jgi:hypothetical protein
MVPLTLDGNGGDGAEHYFSKVHGSRLGVSSGKVLTNCRRAVERKLSCQLLSNVINMDSLSTDSEVFIVQSPLS